MMPVRAVARAMRRSAETVSVILLSKCALPPSAAPAVFCAAFAFRGFFAFSRRRFRFGSGCGGLLGAGSALGLWSRLGFGSGCFLGCRGFFLRRGLFGARGALRLGGCFLGRSGFGPCYFGRGFL